MYSASEWIFLDLWRFINVLLIIIILSKKKIYSEYNEVHHTT